VILKNNPSEAGVLRKAASTSAQPSSMPSENESENFAVAMDGDDDAPPIQNNNHQPAAKEGKRRRRSGIGRGSKKRKQKQGLSGATVATFPGMREDNSWGVAFEAGGGEQQPMASQQRTARQCRRKTRRECKINCIMRSRRLQREMR